MSSQQIRDTWLNFFKEKNHHVEKGASLLPNNDPTLLWINAGVAALKKYFDGREIPPSRRIVNLQKCIRTNDIDNVGKTARHHTFFEMMGNFSIGDYFRDIAIEYGFELLTSEKYFGFEKDKLYVTYYPDDTDTYNKWISLGLDPSHLIASKDNFWEIGEGPCGPDTEIYYDRGEKYDPNHLGIKLMTDEIENDRYIEIWNIVLSQFNAKEGVDRKDYKELPNKNIDTGAGLERFALILQNAETNFDTDLFKPIIDEISKLTDILYTNATVNYRVISDHIKACTFALSDGAYFSNEGRGYVLRRLLRRAVSHGQKLNINKPFLYTLVDVVVDNYSSFYPELNNKREYIKELIKAEEEKFYLTLAKGEALLKEMALNHNIDAFKLYDTYGFPLELTIELANELNEKINVDEFNKQMNIQKERARSARGDKQSMQSQSEDLLNCSLESKFIYENKYIKSKVIALFKNGKKVDQLFDEGEIMFEKTNFYAESGGQISDIGFATNKNCLLQVINVLKAPYKQHLHYVKVENGSVKIGDSFTLKINKNRRKLIMRNHSAAHLLDATLAKILGSNVEQRGSFVGDEYLRFDFNYGNKIDSATIKKIENSVNEQIAYGLDVDVLTLPIEEAKKLGAKMLFTEKYGDVVRVVKMGDYSLEFCGGTHVNNTSEIGIFKIESEESIASGIRRITARTSLGAINYLNSQEKIINDLILGIGAKSVSEINPIINSLIKERNLLKENLSNLQLKEAKNLYFDIKNKFEEKNGTKIFVEKIDGADRSLLINIANNLKRDYQNYLIIIFGDSSIYVSTDQQNYNAGLLIKKICSNFGGSGGGKPTEANGKLNSSIDENLIKEYVGSIL